MHTRITLLAALATGALIIGSSVAFAQMPPPFDGNGSTTGPHGGRPPLGMHASSTWEGGPTWRTGSSTGMRGPGMGENMRGIPGIVTEVDTNSFIIATHLPPMVEGIRGSRMGQTGSTTGAVPTQRPNVATTTLTVNVTNATTYRNGSSTASFSDITVGSKVLVMGRLSTSTKSVDATNVLIGIGNIGGPHEDNGKGNGEESGQGGFLHALGGFFGTIFGHGPSGSTTPQGGPGGGPGAAIWNFLFGWMQH